MPGKQTTKHQNKRDHLKGACWCWSLGWSEHFQKQDRLTATFSTVTAKDRRLVIYTDEGLKLAPQQQRNHVVFLISKNTLRLANFRLTVTWLNAELGTDVSNRFLGASVGGFQHIPK